MADASGASGEILSVSDDGILVAAAGGAILVKRVRPSGGDKGPAIDHAKAANIAVGVRFGS